MREKIMSLLVWLMWKPIGENLHLKLRGWHETLLQQEMAARRKRNQKEVRTGVYWMSPEELDEHSRNY
jgi:hypothetical protein